jgi:hypothetical protein
LGVAVAVVVVTLSACNETRRSKYRTSAEAVSDHAFERGWLPEQLCEGATNIAEFHDLDSNHGGAEFDYSARLAETVKEACSEIPAGEHLRSPLVAWPKLVEDQPTVMELSRRGIAAHRCGSFTVLLNGRDHTGLLWE